MDKIDAVFKVCFHGTIPQPDYSKTVASNLVGSVDTFFLPMHGNNPIILFQLLPNLVINFSLKNQKNEERNS